VVTHRCPRDDPRSLRLSGYGLHSDGASDPSDCGDASGDEHSSSCWHDA
jgi:hypothetical protein